MNRRFRSWGLLFLAGIAVTLTAPRVRGQEVSAGIVGNVTDSTGASIVGATVTAKDQERGTSWPTVSNNDGVYALPRIPAGAYEIRVEAKGFRAEVRRDVHLEINDRLRLNFTLEVGAVSQTLEVTGAGVLLQTENTQIGTVISGNSNVNLPLNGRNYVQLALLSPGATTVDPSSFTNGQRTGGGGRPYVNGNREEANNFLLDGVDNNNNTSNMVAYQPNVDAIEEFRMITTNASAEFGNFQGAVVSVFIKSGTNQFHGTAFEFLRNNVLNANSWAGNWQGLPRAALRHNVFGGTGGGRIIKDRLFFFADYQGIRRANPGNPSSVSVFPLDFRQGDFSRFATQLYNPFSLSSAGVRSPFPGNQIPQSLIDPVARNLFASSFYPQPINSATRFNAVNASSSYVNTDQGDIKVDARITSKDNYSARYSQGRQDVPATNTIPVIISTFQTNPFLNGMMSWTRTISPTLVNELRVGINRILLDNGGLPGSLGNLGQQLGIADSNARGPGLLALNFTGGLATSIGNANIGPARINWNNAFHYADNLSIIRGKHLMKTGFQWQREQANAYIAGNSGRTGSITFKGQYTSGPNPGSPTSQGLADADFLLGLPTDVALGTSTGFWGQRYNILGAYFQDDWHATSTLTLNLGVRWEFHSPMIEVDNRQTNFQFYTGKEELAGQNGVPRNLVNPYYKDFQPRFGFAWTPRAMGGKTVVRGAYTISSDMEGMGIGNRLTLNPPWVNSYAAVYDGHAQPGSTTDQGLGILQPTNPFQGATLYMWDPNIRPANVQQWSFIVERQLPMDTVVWLGYVGEHGTQLALDEGYFQRILLSNGTTLPSPYVAGNPALAGISSINGTSSDGSMKYDALQLSVRKRLSHGLEYQLAYTWSKSMSNSIGYYGQTGGQADQPGSNGQNLYNRAAEWGPSYFNVGQLFSFNVSYELPFGRGKPFGANWNPVGNAILGNWRLGGILSLHSGFPITVTALDRSGTVTTGARANCVTNASGSRQVGPNGTWFNTAAFKQPTAGTFGSCGVGTTYGPGLRDFDMSVQKDFHVTEGKRLELRMEFFNFTNTPIFNAPNANVNAATFGQITGAQGERNVQVALKFYY